jgi:hypothetical protein
MNRFLGGGDPDTSTMYQTTNVTSPGKPTLYNAKALPKPYQIKETNRIDDIPGTQTVSKFDKFQTRPAFNAAVDLPESVPKIRMKTRNCIDRQLMISDIDGAQYSAIGGMDRTNRQIDPLQPEYKLPSFTISADVFTAASLSPPRDIMNVKDIPGAQSRHFGPNMQKPIRDPLAVNDIDGAAADYHGFKSVRERFEKSLRQSRHFKGEITGKGTRQEDYNPITFESVPKFAERTTRRSDPVQPVYQFNGLIIADNEKTKPKKPKAYIDQGTFSLMTQDIPGATSSNSPKRRERREVRDIMNTSDVLGAQADTVVHSLVTNRVTCPLSPVYQTLDDGSPLRPSIKPLLNSEQVKHPSLRLLQTQRNEEVTAQLAASKLSQHLEGRKLGSEQNIPVEYNLLPDKVIAAPFAAALAVSESMPDLRNSPYYSPIHSSRSGAASSRSEVFSPVRFAANTEGKQEMQWPSHGQVPKLNTQALAVPHAKRETAMQISRREEIEAVRSLR